LLVSSVESFEHAIGVVATSFLLLPRGYVLDDELIRGDDAATGKPEGLGEIVRDIIVEPECARKHHCSSIGTNFIIPEVIELSQRPVPSRHGRQKPEILHQIEAVPLTFDRKEYSIDRRIFAARKKCAK